MTVKTNDILKNKAAKAGTPNPEVAAQFDRRAPEAIAFAWNVGVGDNTGIGFGALK